MQGFHSPEQCHAVHLHLHCPAVCPPLQVASYAAQARAAADAAAGRCALPPHCGSQAALLRSAEHHCQLARLHHRLLRLVGDAPEGRLLRPRTAAVVLLWSCLVEPRKSYSNPLYLICNACQRFWRDIGS